MVFDTKVGPKSKMGFSTKCTNARPLSESMVFSKRFMPLSDGNANEVSDNFSAGLLKAICLF